MKCPICGEITTVMNQRESDPPQRIEKCLFCNHAIPRVVTENIVRSTPETAPVPGMFKLSEKRNAKKPVAVGMLLSGVRDYALTELGLGASALFALHKFKVKNQGEYDEKEKQRAFVKSKSPSPNINPRTHHVARTPVLGKMDTAKMASLLLLSVGILTVVASAVGSVTTFALMGLSMVFWGALLLYIRPSKYVKSELLTSLHSPMKDIDRIIKETKSTGKGIYLPQKSLKYFHTSIVFVPPKPITRLPQLEEVTSDSLLNNNPQGLLLTPPGFSLCQLFERTVGTPFTAMSLKSLQERMPKLFIEELGIADRLEMQTENNTVTVEITKSIFADICKETAKLQKIHNSVGCPICSAIACALAEATGKPIAIEEEQSSDGKTTTRYRIMEE